MNKIIIIIIFFIFISSCFRETIISDAALEEYQPKPVVYCILTNQDSIFAWVSHTLPFLDYNNNNLVDSSYEFNAKVVLKNQSGDSLILNPTNSSLPIYGNSSKNFSIIKGQTFFLKVTLPDKSYITANTTIPQLNDSFVNISTSNQLVVDSINDLKYFPITIKYTNNYNFVKYYLYNDLFNRGFRFENIWNYLENNKFTNPIIEKDGIYADYFDPTSQDNLINNTIHLYLYAVSPEITNFANSYKLYQQSGSDNFLEMYRGRVAEYTNITGGYGFFGSFITIDSDSVKILPPKF